MKNVFLAILIICVLFAFVSCNPDQPIDPPTPPGGGSIDPATYKFSNTLDMDTYTACSVSIPAVDESTLTKISLSGTKTDSVTQEITENTLITIDNFTLASESKGLVISGNGDVYIKLIGSNSIASAKNAIDADDLDGNIYFYGTGSLKLLSSSKSGIKAKKSKLEIYEGTYEISLPEGSGGDGIRCSSFTLYSGKITISALGKLIKESYEDYPGSKGLQAKAVNSENDGNITIYGGEIDILSYGKSLTANYGDYTSSATCGNVLIKNGYITLRTIGTPVEDTSETIEDGISPEGLEAKNTLTVTNGVIQVCSTDDSLNGLNKIDISGGYIFGLSTKNDCIDSNCKLFVSGGKVVALCCVEGGPEKAIDSDIGESRDAEFSYTGGTIVAIGKNSSDQPNSGSTNKFIQKTADVSKTISVQNGSSEIVRYCVPNDIKFGSSAYVLVCDAEAASSCEIKNTSEAVSSSDNFNGLDLSV